MNLLPRPTTSKSKKTEARRHDIQKIREDFPVLHQKVNGRPLVYLDNAATTQKPRAVIEAIGHFYTKDNSNVHRGVHTLSGRATDAYEKSRVKVQQFINARKSHEIIFVRGTTEGINLVANSFGRARIEAGDEILVTTMEHHANIVPWQILCKERGAHLRIAPITDRGEIILEAYEELITPRTKLAAIVHVSNALGTVNPIKRMVDIAHSRGVPALVDGAQSAPHMRVDVQELGCDFFAFSSHKMYGPTGIGALYGRAELLDSMPPYEGGGDMIQKVTFEKTTYNKLPYKFEAGTPNIAGAVGFGATIDYLNDIGQAEAAAHESDLLASAIEGLSGIRGLRIIGTAENRAGAISFVIEGVHPHDVGTVLDLEGVAIRTGHHCCQPTMERFGVPATCRASFGLYNTRGDVDALVSGVLKARELFRGA